MRERQPVEQRTHYVDNGDGTVTREFRSTSPVGTGEREFIRLLMSE